MSSENRVITATTTIKFHCVVINEMISGDGDYDGDYVINIIMMSLLKK